jgi:hypothetical protein
LPAWLQDVPDTVAACELVAITEVKTRTIAKAVDNRLNFFIGTRQMVVETSVKII